MDNRTDADILDMLAKANNKQESEEVNMDKWEAKQTGIARYEGA